MQLIPSAGAKCKLYRGEFVFAENNFGIPQLTVLRHQSSYKTDTQHPIFTMKTRMELTRMRESS